MSRHGADPSVGSTEPLDSAPPSIPSAAAVLDPIVPLSSAAAAAAAESGLEVTEEPGTAPVRPGSVLAERYEVEYVLGEGGMGIVYACRDRATGDEVALKRVIPPDPKHALDYLMWFYKEARALAVLDHPNIVRARDFGRLVDGSPFLVMDLVSGVSLHDLSYAKLSFPLVWSIVDQTLAALAHAHARGIVHGDLKPSNVLVEEHVDGPPTVHILDFGLAWLKQDPHDERLDGSKALEFTPHAGAGTPGYMAPEQIQHEMHHVVGATDLYSLGCIVYRMVSGKAPFTGEPKELLKRHAFEPVPTPALSIEAPEGVIDWVLRALAKRGWDRWEFAAEARRDWAALKPARPSKKAWHFPRLARRAPVPQPPTAAERSAERSAPELGLAKEHAGGLLSIRPSPLVGREDIRRTLLEACDDVIAGRGDSHRLILLVGQAGVGKSRLAEWLCEQLHEAGTMVPLRARYRRVRSTIDGMVGAVTQYFNFERAERDTIEKSLLARWHVDKQDKNGRAWVAGAAEWMRPTAPGSAAPLGPSGMRFTLDSRETRRMVTRYTLRRISRGRPLLFWLDDLHHGTAGTFEGLKRIHEEEPDQPLVMVGTVRSEDVQLGTPVAEHLRDLRELMGGEVIEVEPLEDATTIALLRAALPLDDDAAAEAAKRSRGNPLFALQQLHAWALNGNIELQQGAYRVPKAVLALRPQTTAELWDSRLATLPAEHRPAAYALATLGGDIRRPVLVALLQLLELPPEECIRSLQQAEVMLPRGSGGYAWPHALLQEHLLARLKEQPDAARTFAAAAEALLQHPLAGGRRITRQRVLNLLQAGRNEAAAQALFSYLERAWYAEREPATTIADLDLLKGHVQDSALAQKHRWQAEALRHLGRTDEAITHAEIARTSFEELGDHEHTAHCLRLLGHLASEKGRSTEGLQQVAKAHQLFEELGHVLGMALCEVVTGELSYLLGDYERGRVALRAGEAHFAEIGQPLGRGQCLLLSSWIEHSEGALRRSQRLALEAHAEFEAAGYRLGIAQNNASLAHLEHRMHNYASAEEQAREALQSFEQFHNPRGHAACERLLAMISLDTDDLDGAEAHATTASAIYGTMGDPWGIVESAVLEAQVAIAQRRFDAARSILDERATVALEEAEPRQHQLVTRAWLHHQLGEPDAALELIEEAANVFEEPTQVGDHLPQLLDRLSRLEWPEHAYHRLEAWRARVNDRTRRDAD